MTIESRTRTLTEELEDLISDARPIVCALRERINAFLDGQSGVDREISERCISRELGDFVRRGD